MRSTKGWTKGWTKGGLVVMATLAVVGEARAAVDLLGQPCRAFNILGGRMVKLPGSGEERAVLTNMNEQSHCELLFIDFRRNKGVAFRAPAGEGSWALDEVPGGRLVVGTYFDGTFMVFDLDKMAFVKTVKFPGEDYIWNQAVGSDGRLYGGTYPGGKLGALDLASYTVEDLGNAAPPNLYLRHVSALPDGRILCHYITDRDTVLVFDPATKKYSPAPGPLATVDQGTVWNGYFLCGSRAFGRDLALVSPPPYPAPPGKGDWSMVLNLTTPQTLYLQQGANLYRFRAGEKALTLVASLSLNGGGYRAASQTGDLFVLRGQDYAVLHPGDKTLKLKRIPVEPGPRPTHFLRLDPKGRLWGGPTFGQTVFRLDPATRKYVNTGTVSNHGGEVFDAAFIGDAMYMVSYAGGEVIRYDTGKAWNQFGNANPRTIATVGPAYIRPSGGIRLGPDGLLYSGWMARYGTYGGALAITDPRSGKTDVVENPLGEQTIHGVAVDAASAYLGSSLEANGLRTKPGESARFGVMGLASRQVTFQHEFPGATFVHALGLDPGTKRLGMLVDKRVAVFDTAKGALVEGLGGLPEATGPDGVAPGNGCYYYASGNDVVALDLATGKPAVLGTLPAPVEHLEVGRDGTAYVSCGVDVYRVRK